MNTRQSPNRRAPVVAAILLFLVSAGVLRAQDTRVVRGVVTDATTGAALGSAQISVVGTRLGTLSEADGTFQIRVPAGEVRLSVALIGYSTAQVTVGPSQGQVSVELRQDVLALDELVVTGRATEVSRRNLPNSIATVSADQVSRVASQTVEQAMLAKVAGANIQANNGAPGGGMSVELRGATSIIGNSRPLYVIDGVIVSNDEISSGVHVVTRSSSNPTSGGQQDNSPNRIADLNPNDIESIEILKGAAASAIYGSKASNGVVIIKTRRGSYGQGPEYRLRQRVGVPDVSNTLGIRRFESLEAAVDAFGPRAEDYWAAGKFYDHEMELAGENPISYETSLSVSGGSDDTRYFLSGLVKDDGGVVIGTGYEKKSLRLNLDHSLSDKAEISVNTNAIRAVTARGFTNNDNRSISYWMTIPGTPSFVDIRRRPDGTFPENPFARSNPLETAHLAVNDEILTRFIGSAQLRLNPWTTETHRLQLQVDGGIDFFNQKNVVFTGPDLQFEQTLGEPGTSIRGDAESQFTNLNASAVHTYTSPSGALNATSSVGLQYERRELDQTVNIAQNLIAGLQNVDRGTNTEVRENRLQTEDFGFFFQEDVLVGSTLLLTAGIRGDQSSNNADPTKIHWYPKAAASYRLTELPGLLDEVKLRVAYGQSGNQPQYGQKFVLLSGANYGGLQALRLGSATSDPDLRPEKQTEIEGGADIAMLDGRASLELTVYQTTISDMLVRRNLPESTGFDVLYFNGGEMRQRGFESVLRTAPVQTRSVAWFSNLTFSLNRGLVTDLPVPPFRPPSNFGGLGSFLIEEGESPTRFVGNDTLADGSIVQNVTIGESRPDYIVGFSNELRFGDFSVFALIDWRQGSSVANLTGWLMDLSKNSHDFADPCTAPECQPGETLGEMRLRLYPSRVTSVWLEDASFVKLRELSISWSVPQSVYGKLWGGIRAANVNLSGRDLLRFTDYSGMDPEVSNFGNQSISRNQDVAPYPPSRSFWLSVDLTF